METKIILVRHGETDWNIQKKFQGSSDIPLNERGRRQAGYAAEALKGEQIDAAYSSPLMRAMETGKIILGDRDIPLVPCEGLREICVGEWEGLTVDEINLRYPGKYELWRKHPSQIKFNDLQGETFEQVQYRAIRTFQRIAAANYGRTILITSHMVCLDMILLYLAGYEIDELWQHPIANAALNIVECGEDGIWNITAWSDESHIPEAERYEKNEPGGARSV